MSHTAAQHGVSRRKFLTASAAIGGGLPYLWRDVNRCRLRGPTGGAHPYDEQCERSRCQH